MSDVGGPYRGLHRAFGVDQRLLKRKPCDVVDAIMGEVARRADIRSHQVEDVMLDPEAFYWCARYLDAKVEHGRADGTQFRFRLYTAFCSVWCTMDPDMPPDIAPWFQPAVAR